MTPLASCTFCASPFVHPKARTPLWDKRLRLDLRCGECGGDYRPEQVNDYYRTLQEGRREIAELYEEVVRANMLEECERLRIALARDLITADDFAR
jgi:hypothetical protein